MGTCILNVLCGGFGSHLGPLGRLGPTRAVWSCHDVLWYCLYNRRVWTDLFCHLGQLIKLMTILF
jgi:hypothetical protein